MVVLLSFGILNGEVKLFFFHILAVAIDLSLLEILSGALITSDFQFNTSKFTFIDFIFCKTLYQLLEVNTEMSRILALPPRSLKSNREIRI